MKLTSTVLFLAFISSAFFSAPVSAKFLDRYIVELDPTSSKPSDIHAKFYGELGNRVTHKVFREYNSTDVFVGASITLESPAHVSAVASIPGVQSVKRVKSISRPSSVNRLVLSHPGDPMVPIDSESTHKMIGVDKLHAMGITGKGVNIAIIDSGIDYTHPSLGGGFGPGHKVAGGFDFVGDAFDGANTPIPDQDPLDQCEGHGTHVAGIIGANPGNVFNISGVAFDSTLFAYRVFGCSGDTGDDILMEALLQAQKDGANVINLSLGDFDNWTEHVIDIALTRLTKMGIIVVAACGNDGATGAWGTSDVSNALGAIAVGSVENTVINLQDAVTSDPSHPTISYDLIHPFPVQGSLPIYATSNDTTTVDDACNPLPDDTPDLSKFLVVVHRGTCAFTTKLQNIADKGARFSFIYDNGMGFSSIATGSFNETALISEDDGIFLVQQFVAGNNITLTFPNLPSTVSSPTGGLISQFSSYGPTNDMVLYDPFVLTSIRLSYLITGVTSKPAVSAPGGNILSTFPVPLGSFAIDSGVCRSPLSLNAVLSLTPWYASNQTSMASPHMAGCAALLFQTKGKSLEVAQSALVLFETTAQMLPSSLTDGDPLETLALQGAGMINAFNALTYNTTLSPGELLLNDSSHFVQSHVLTVTNARHTFEMYNVTHIAAGTSLTYESGDIIPLPSPVPLTTDCATAEIEPKILIVPPFGSAKVTVTIKPPQNVDAQTFPVFSGFIQIQGIKNGEKLHASYLGLAARTRDFKVLDNTNETLGIQLPSLVDDLGNPILDAKNYTFEGDDIPRLFFRLASGSPKVKADLVESSFKLPSNNGPIKDIPVLGNITDFDFITRSILTANEEALNGTYSVNMTQPLFGDNSTISNGLYRILLRALKTSGDLNNEEDYETFLSPIVGVAVSGQ